MSAAASIQSPPDGPASAEVILEWLSSILARDQIVEVRAIKAGKGPTVRRFGPDQRVEMVALALAESRRSEGVYFTLNPILTETTGTATDGTIERRCLVLVDCDPTRDAEARRAAGEGVKLSANDAEKAAAQRMAFEVKSYLEGLGWPDPVEADSGNGYHLLYAVDLPNDNASRDLVKAVLVALQHRFGTAEADIDTTVYNASRITKFYGTVARKGLATVDRPHRVSKILVIPDGFADQVVNRNQLEAVAEIPAVAGKLFPDSPTVARPTFGGLTAKSWTAEARAEEYLRNCDGAIQGKKGSGQTLKICVKAGPGFDLPEDVAFNLVFRIYNPKCDPPWSEKDLRRKVTEAYRVEPRRGWMLEKDHNGHHSTNGQAAPPPSGGNNKTTEQNPPDDPKPNEAKDDPHRLARVYLESLRRLEGPTLVYWREEWHRWDGTHYRICPDKEVRGELTSSVKTEFDRINLEDLKACNPDKAPPVVKPVTTRKISDVIQALTGEALVRAVDCPEQPAWLNIDPPFPADEVLPCRNALVHLPGLAKGLDASHCMVAPTPAFFGAYALDFDYRPDAPRPGQWLKFLSQIWPDDPESIEMLQEWFGYNITSDTSQQKMLMMIGPKRSGRGTIARVMQALLGSENVVTPTLTGFSTHFGAASLIGKPCAIFTDARISGRSDVSIAVERLLSITGEDPQTIPRKNRDDWKGRLRTRFTLISNELPKLTDVSGALPSRMIVLRFTQTFLGREDKDLERKLRDELPGILLWAIGGWRRLNERGRFVQPKSAEDLVEQMENLSSPVGEFVKDTCVVGPSHEIITSDLYESWKHWCQENGIDHAGSGPMFGRNLCAAFHSVRTSNPTTRGEGKKVRLYQGIDLSLEEKARKRAAETKQAAAW